MAFRFDKLTIKAQEALASAQSLAAERGHPEIDPLHLLSSLLAETGGVIIPVLEQVGVDMPQLRQIVASELGHFPRASGGAPPQVGAALGRVLEKAQNEADAMKDDYVSTEHLLLALAKVDSKAQRVLELAAIDEKRLLAALQKIRGSGSATRTRRRNSRALEKYGINLVEPGPPRQLDPVIGRDQEIRRVIQVLSRRTKTTPC